MAGSEPASLVSTHKASDSGLRAHLHPLVLLTISDFITRHTLRRREDPIVGALIGQQNGRDISLEHAFECQVTQGDQGAIILHQAWFQERLQQYKDVHKAPALELVGWFSTAPASGPQSQHVPIHQQITHEYNETALLLAFHPSSVLEGAAVGGKLPLTIYESVYESGQESGKAARESGDDATMEVEGRDGALELRFREVPYFVETGEAEMISVDFVARGGGNATAVDTSTKKGTMSQASQGPASDTLRDFGQPKEAKAIPDKSILSPEDEELIASLTARANAVKMLHTRIQLLKTYLQNLPPSYLTSPSPPSNPSAASDPSSTTATSTQISHPLLRSIQALLHRLPLLLPADRTAFAQESLAEKSDVSLVALLGSLSQSIKETKEMGRKFGIVDQVRQVAGKKGYAGGSLSEDLFPEGGGRGRGVGTGEGRGLGEWA